MSEVALARKGWAGRLTGRGLWGLLLVAVPVGLVGWLIVWPIVEALISTVYVSSEGTGHWTLASYRFFFTDGYSLANLGITIWTTAVSAAILLAIALPIALYLRFRTGRLPAYVQSLAVFPLFVPSIILAYAFVRTLGPNGMVDTVLNAAGLPKIRTPYLTPWGPVIGLVWDNIPLTVLIVLSGLAEVKTAAIEAARDVGAGRIAILWHIILPRISNSILVALSFVILGMFSAFTFPYLLGPAAPEMMGPFMLRTFTEVNNPIMARSQAVITFAFCAFFGFFYVRAVAKNRKARDI